MLWILLGIAIVSFVSKYILYNPYYKKNKEVQDEKQHPVRSKKSKQ